MQRLSLRTRAILGARIRERRLRPANVSGVRVLTYHGLVDTKRDPYLERNFHTVEQFRSHIHILRRQRVVPVEDVVEAAKSASKLTVAITFDDGYKNNQIAAELLAAAHLPWALYVSTGAIGGDSTIWTAQLGLLLLHGHAASIEAFGREWDLSDRAHQLESFQAVRNAAKRLSQADRIRFLDDLVTQFDDGEEERLIAAFPQFQMLNWDDLRSMAASGTTIGSHGVNHEIHHADQPTPVIESELSGSQSMLRSQLRVASTTLAYPNGNWTDRSRRVAEQLGYRTAFTTVDDVVRGDADPFSLPRLAALGNEVAFTRSLLSGRTSGR